MKVKFENEPQAIVATRGIDKVYSTVNFDITKDDSGGYEAESVVIVTDKHLDKSCYPKVVSAIIRSRYSADDVEAITLNYLSDKNDLHDSELAELESWRRKAKSVAREILNCEEK